MNRGLGSAQTTSLFPQSSATVLFVARSRQLNLPLTFGQAVFLVDANLVDALWAGNTFLVVS
jgi:hypothetical protein